MNDLRPMFRAVPRDSWQPGQRLTRQTTRRTPSNVPYLVDNLWEALRPSHLPSRRHAVYASPTPDLALINATGRGEPREAFVVTRLVVSGEVKQVQLSCTDARHHLDVTTLPRAILNALGEGWPDLSTEMKLPAGLLYIPGVSQEEIVQAAMGDAALERALACAYERSTMWRDAEERPNPMGEFFFEMMDEAFYTLEPLDSR